MHAVNKQHASWPSRIPLWLATYSLATSIPLWLATCLFWVRHSSAAPRLYLKLSIPHGACQFFPFSIVSSSYLLLFPLVYSVKTKIAVKMRFALGTLAITTILATAAASSCDAEKYHWLPCRRDKKLTKQYRNRLPTIHHTNAQQMPPERLALSLHSE